MTPVRDPNLIAQLESGSSGMTPVTDPALISQLEGNSSSQMNPLIRAASNIDIGGANFGRNLLNAPHNIANFINPQLGAMVPGAPSAINNVNYNQVYGVNNPNLADKLVQGAAQYAPYAATGGAAGGADLGAQAATGALYGLTQSQNPLMGAAVGGLTNAVTGGAGQLLAPGMNSVKSYLSKFATSGLTKSLGNSLQDAKNATNAQAFNLAKQNLQQNWIPKEQAAWNNLSQTASQVDANGIPFNDDNYNAAIQKQLANLQGQSSRQSGFARANKDSQNLLQNYLADAHGSFTDAIEHNKALNQDFQNEIAPGQPLPFRTVNFAKSNLANAINQNIQNNGLQDTLGSAWNSANAITQQKNQLFNNVVGNTGKESISKFSNFINGKNPNADPTAFVNDYLPTNRGDGIQKMQQFSQMVGDPDTARNVLKQNYFDKAFTSSGIDGKAFLSRYNNLSDDQQNFMFSPQENQTIQALNKINEFHPDAFSNSANNLAHHSIAATLGGVLGMASGHGLWEGLGLGIAGGMAAHAGLSKLFENPTISSYFINALTKTPATGMLPSAAGVGARLGTPTLQSILTPALTRALGGQ